MDFAGRVARLRERLRRERADAFFVAHLPNIRYLTNFSGSNGLLLVTSDQLWFFSDNRYREQTASEVTGARVRIVASGDLWAAAMAKLRRARRLAVEADRISWSVARRLKEARAKHQRLLAARGWVEELRIIKEPEEIAAIRAAVRLASSAFPGWVRGLRAGQSELAWAARLEYSLRRRGAEGLSFETIVASGRRAAHVHGRASEKTVQPGDLVVIDYGIWLHGYASDMTRTLAVAGASRRARALYGAVLEAQQAAIAAVRPGVAYAAVDRAARRVLSQAGYRHAFVHALGHGVGLEIHEAPRLARRTPGRLAAGQVITIEPGAYLPAWGGVRIEDVVAVTPHGADVLTPTGKELTVIGA